jgi:hypothetical protein
MGSKQIAKCLALSPNTYSNFYCEMDVKKAKGVSLVVSDKAMTFSDYKSVLESINSQTRTVWGIRSFNQQLYNTCEDKVVLSSFNDKMVIVDSINCIPYG